MTNNLIDMKAAMLGLTAEERAKLLREVSLEEQVRSLREENAKLKARRGGRPPAEKLSSNDVQKAKIAVIQAFVKVEQANLDALKPGQLDDVMAQVIPESSKSQRRDVLSSMVEAKTIEHNGKKGAGAAFFRVR